MAIIEKTAQNPSEIQSLYISKLKAYKLNILNNNTQNEVIKQQSSFKMTIDIPEGFDINSSIRCCSLKTSGVDIQEPEYQYIPCYFDDNNTAIIVTIGTGFLKDGQTFAIYQDNVPYESEEDHVGFVLDKEINTSTNATGAGWTWKSSTRTLILNNANLTIPYVNIPPDDMDIKLNTVIYLPLNSTIEVHGTNKVTVSGITPGISVAPFTISGLETMTFTGDGSIETNGSIICRNLDCWGEKAIQIGRIIFNENINLKAVADSDYSSGLSSDYILINGGTLDLYGRCSGINASRIFVNGGTVYAKSSTEMDPMDTGLNPAAIDGDLILGDKMNVKCKSADGSYSTNARLGSLALTLYNDYATPTVIAGDTGSTIATDVMIYSVPDTSVNSKFDGIQISADNGVFPYGTVVTAQKITKGANYDMAKLALKGTSDKFIAFDIFAVNNNISVQPNGNVTVAIDIPDDFDADNIAVYFIPDEFNMEELETLIRHDSIIAKLKHFSTYVLAEKNGAAPTENNNAAKSPETGEHGNPIIPFVLIIISSLAVIGTIFARKKKSI